MSQKTNKIIVVISVVILIALIVIILLIGKKNSNISQKGLLLSTPYEYYKKCSSYLGQPQTLKNGITVIPPQVYCKVENNEVKLIHIDEVNDLKTGDFVILVVDTKRLINEDNFKRLYSDKITSEKLPIPTGNFTLCLYYLSYLDDANFTLFPMEFNYDKLRGGSLVAACSPRRTLYNLDPIGLVGTIPQNAKGNNFGITIVLPPSNLYDDSNIKAEAVVSNPLFFQKIYSSYIPIQK